MSSWPAPYNVLGCYLYSSGQFPEARSVLARALEFSPDNEYAQFFFSVAALLDDDPEAALSGVAPYARPHRQAILAMASTTWVVCESPSRRSTS